MCRMDAIVLGLLALVAGCTAQASPKAVPKAAPKGAFTIKQSGSNTLEVKAVQDKKSSVGYCLEILAYLYDLPDKTGDLPPGYTVLCPTDTAINIFLFRLGYKSFIKDPVQYIADNPTLRPFIQRVFAYHLIPNGATGPTFGM
ncbi:hypothetical protein MNEG_11853 [Monoraphidium neglectum]|uniref:FAS1 domain-containing protein n=1 Tax=Monoraphidium neglectum TaxID=145388 RepID=A0A0D2MMZ1_9CHLO|nr:hypothetical protein MNEG_11853 [Monoraphidium neglectum]KIY96110.1 hypothetical protein MNEG_11853 [Monoraphidium neglectum]|eukprot:XP_013895130.1 hypothetical protein MNEG_11853 [Monoraphidium neglectum]